ncbi:MAG: monofunctional biosynthetic peptidoglycan transglycosylase [Aquabacterium sp.]|nr:monofunctional biosynthetic peptidoglycan transglycosylase [Aquabacterium sp.]
MRAAGRLLILVALCTLSLELTFVARVALMAGVDPQSSAFQRSEAWRLLQAGRFAWRQQWVDDGAISNHLRRAVIAAEDAGFTEHSGVEWEAVERAWSKNARLAQRPSKRPPKLVGGSTITQQLAKNLLLSGERTLMRKGQELLITWSLELLLDKRRILEIYLNQVEWGEGVFGAQAAARHYFRTDAAQLDAGAAARLAVLLPAPKRYGRQPYSAYVSARAGTVLARMPAVDLP